MPRVQTWKNRDNGLVVKTIIDGNFNTLSQYAEPYVYKFTEDSWVNYQLNIPATVHGKNIHANVAVFIETTNGYEAVITDNYVRKNGDVIIFSDVRFNGKALVM